MLINVFLMLNYLMKLAEDLDKNPILLRFFKKELLRMGIVENKYCIEKDDYVKR